ncbi:MAG TPA: DinB family protein [Acidimicrobiales bacterium]|nr:DinB family protein [Acidimicrobiales bacterium]
MSTNLGDASGTLDFATTDACDTCRFSASRVTPEEAVLALRSFPSRWRQALAVHLDDTDPEAVIAARPTALDWSALEHAGHVRDVLHALDIRLQRVLREDEPVLPETHVTPPSGANEQGFAVVMAALTVSTDQFSQTIELTPSAAWGRRARRSGRPVTALDLIREAVHEGTHHLKLASQTLSRVRAAAAASLN